MKLWNKFFLLIAITWLSPLYAMKFYGAKPDESLWKMTIDNPLECRLEHEIPFYGDASFSSRASKKINLDFFLKMKIPMGKTASVSLVSMPAPWMPGAAVTDIDRLRFYKQFDGYIDGQIAWNMLSLLEQGQFPTFSYQEWQSKGKEVSIYLSPVAFLKNYNEFSQCISKLLPYSFEDIAFTTLNYKDDSIALNQTSEEKLAKIAEYLRYTKDIDLILMASYTNSRGTQEDNLAISQKRAQELEKFFISLGLPKDRIQIQAFGEKRPIAINDTYKGRMKNRRVVVSLGRSVF